MKKFIAPAAALLILLSACSGGAQPQSVPQNTTVPISSANTTTVHIPVDAAVFLYDKRGGTTLKTEYKYTDDIQPETLLGALGDMLSVSLATNSIRLVESEVRIDLSSSGAVSAARSAEEVKGLLDSVAATFQGCYGRALLVYFTLDGGDAVLFGTELSGSLPYTGGGEYIEVEGEITSEQACEYIVNLSCELLKKEAADLTANYEGQLAVKNELCYIVSVSCEGQILSRFAVSLDGGTVLLQNAETGAYKYY